MAASTGGIPLENLPQIAEALGLGPDATVEDILATIAAMAKKLQEATSPTEEMPAVAEAATETDDEEPPAVAARRRTARTTLSVGFVEETLTRVEKWRKSYVETANRARAAEADERRRLVGELVKLGAETPATAWADAKGTVPVKRLAAEPLAELKDRVQKLTAGRGNAGASRNPANTPPPSPPPGTGAAGLTDRQLQICRDAGRDPEDYAADLRRYGRM